MDRTLTTASHWKELAKQGATRDDLNEYVVFKAGRVLKSVADMASPRTVSFVLSTAKIDREGDSLAVGGWDLSDYRNNPVVLWAHDHSAPPVGKALETVVDGPMLKANDEFVSADLYPFGAMIYRMIQGKFLNACSVGFLPTEWEMSETGVNFLKQGLLEHSICPVPAHPEALVIARSQGIDVAPMKAWAEKTLDLLKHGTDAKYRRDIERLRAQADPVGRKLFTVLSELRIDAEEIIVDGLPIVPSRRASRRGKADLGALEAQLARVQTYKLTDANREKVQDEVARLQAQIADTRREKTPRRAAPRRRTRDRSVSETPEAASLATITSVLADVVAVLPEALASAETLLEDPASAAPEALPTLVSACVDAIEKLTVVAEGAQALIAAALGPVESADVGGRAARFDSLRSFVAVVGKAGARHSAADVALLQDAHDQLVALGAACKTDASADEVGIEDDADTRALVRAVAELAVEEAVMRATGRLR